MIKTINLSAGTETEVELTGGCHAKIENRGTGTIYVSKSADVAAGADGTMAVSASATKYMKDVASYMQTGNTFDYFGTIYIVSSEDGLAEIETGNYFFSEKNSSKGGGDTPSADTYTKDEIDVKLADKVGKNDFATKTVGGAVKIDSAYGIEIDRNGTLRTIPAYDNYMQNFTDDNHVITPYRFKKAMGLFGINSETQITEMQSDISILKNNSVNLIPYPYTNQNYVNGEWKEAVEVGGVTFTPAADGIILNGTNTSGERIIFSFAENFKLKAGETYTLSDSSEREFKSNIRIRYTDYNNMNSNLFGISTSKKVTYTAANDYNGMVYFSIDNGVSFDNVVFKPVLEIGNTAHAFKEYKDDLNSLIRSIIKRIDTLEG